MLQKLPAEAGWGGGSLGGRAFHHLQSLNIQSDLVGVFNSADTRPRRAAAAAEGSRRRRSPSSLARGRTADTLALARAAEEPSERRRN